MGELLSRLRDPRVALPTCGYVRDQATEDFVQYDPYAITDTFQADILEYYANPPRDENGRTRWAYMIGYRQAGKSTAAEFAAYCLTAYTPGLDHICLADTDDRAKYLHSRVHELDQRWPEEIKAPRSNTREKWQLTFDGLVGGTMRTLSMAKGSVGIGQSPGSAHWSEIPFCPDQAAQWSGMLPSLRNRADVRVLLETTCNPDDSQGFAQELYLSGLRGDGRLFSLFYPFWDGKLNSRPWPKNSALDTEEQRLLDKYGPQGLRLEHLAFRRECMADDVRIRLNPDEFGIWYPFDDVTCWARTSGGIFSSLLDRHAEAELVAWKPTAQFYPGDSGHAEPDPDAVYALAVDPCGYAARDHGAAQLVEVWDDVWYQVGVFSGGRRESVDPEVLARWVFDTGMRYNKALVVVESTGVGQGVLTLLRAWGYPNLYYESKGNPGIAATTKSNGLSLTALRTALKDLLVLRDADTVGQLQTYRNDKNVQDGVQAEQLRGEVGRRRRERHHWDKVSALQWVCWAAKRLPARLRTITTNPRDITTNPWEKPEGGDIVVDIEWAKGKWEEHKRARRKGGRGWKRTRR